MIGLRSLVVLLVVFEWTSYTNANFVLNLLIDGHTLWMA